MTSTNVLNKTEIKEAIKDFCKAKSISQSALKQCQASVNATKKVVLPKNASPLAFDPFFHLLPLLFEISHHC